MPNRFEPIPGVVLRHPEWSKNATIYQINTRQFTPVGTFRAAIGELPRLADLGVTILWLMPVHEIGVERRKGALGSPYAVRDYYSVNREFGTKYDLAAFVRAAHEQGMYVLLDWVANHTAWDNILVNEHPDWYIRDWKGDYRPTPWWDWDDIIDLDFSRPALRHYLTEAMCYWVRELDVDGFRCDTAGFVPVDFWEQARRELVRLKDVFMLAEWESRDLHRAAFDMSYAWSWNDTLHRIAAEHRPLTGLYVYYSWNEKAWPRDAMRMTFVTNHDKNAWEGTEFEQFGPALEAAMVLSGVGEGMPLIYNGQEAGYDHRLEFFDKDPIVWKEHRHGDLYRRLVHLKLENTALWNGAWGARMVDVPNSHHDWVLSFVRANNRDKVFAAFNFSPDTRGVTFAPAGAGPPGGRRGLHHGAYRDFGTGTPLDVGPDLTWVMRPWSYRVLVADPR